MIADPTSLEDLVQAVGDSPTDVQDLIDLLDGDTVSINAFVAALYSAGKERREKSLKVTF